MSKVLRYSFVLIFLIKLFECLYFFSHGDAFCYHLAGPKLWLESSLAQMTSEHYQFFQAGIFDYLYVLPVKIFDNSFRAQQMAQAMHFLFGLGFASLLARNLAQRKFSEDWGNLAGIIFLTLNHSADFFLYAKNDGVLASFGFFAALIAFDYSFLPKVTGNKRWILLGVLLGLLPSIKMSGMFVSVVIAGVWFWRGNKKNIMFVMVAAILTMLPMLLRNYFYLGNPIFPGLANLVRGKLTDGQVEYFTLFMSNPITKDSLWQLLKIFFAPKIILLITPVLAWRSIKSAKNDLVFYMVALLIFLMYAKTNGGIAVARFFFTCYFLVAWTFVLLAAKQLHNKSKNWLWLVFAISVVDGRLDISGSRIVTAFGEFTAPQEKLIAKYSPISALWRYFPQEQIEKTLVLSDYFAELYYAPRNYWLVQYKIDPRAEFMRHCESVDVASQMSRFQYAIFYFDHPENACYQWVQQNAKLIAREGDYRIYQLR